MTLFGWIAALTAATSYAGFAATDLILPAVGRVDGAAGSHFYTTVWVTNPSNATVSFEMTFLASLPASAAKPPVYRATLGPDATIVYENVAETLFGVKGVVGTARIVSSGELLASSRIYNLAEGSSSASSSGQFFAAVPAEFGAARGEEAVLQGVRADDDFRYTFLLAETLGKPTRA
ncbi:MAG TPA: hypothetical protein VN605_05330, partial [Thermoanaerobaculia bacterium]|nr:hypothetical protein [Thermoanaerobaculia bacterium]